MTVSAGRVSVSSSRVAPIITLTPMGTGRTISARIVATKIARRCCCVVVNAGSGRKYRPRPGPTTIAQRRSGNEEELLMGWNMPRRAPDRAQPNQGQRRPAGKNRGGAQASRDRAAAAWSRDIMPRR